MLGCLYVTPHWWTRPLSPLFSTVSIKHFPQTHQGYPKCSCRFFSELPSSKGQTTCCFYHWLQNTIAMVQTSTSQYLRVQMPMDNLMILVGNVGNTAACVAAMPTLLAKIRLMPNVTNAMTGFMAGSSVGWRVTAQLPSHIHDSCGYYSNGHNGRFLRKIWYVYMK